MVRNYQIGQINFPPKLTFLISQNSKFKMLTDHQRCFRPLKMLPTVYGLKIRVDYRYFEHRAISNTSIKNMKRLRMRDNNSSLFISLLKLVNFNNTFALFLYFFLCQDTSGKCFFRSAKINSRPITSLLPLRYSRT